MKFYTDRIVNRLYGCVAEREGFEPSMGITPYTLSRRAPSAARTPLLVKGGNPNQPHPGARVYCCRCSLPGLTGFTTYRREGTGVGRHRGPVSYPRGLIVDSRPERHRPLTHETVPPFARSGFLFHTS